MVLAVDDLVQNTKQIHRGVRFRVCDFRPHDKRVIVTDHAENAYNFALEDVEKVDPLLIQAEEQTALLREIRDGLKPVDVSTGPEVVFDVQQDEDKKVAKKVLEDLREKLYGSPDAKTIAAHELTVFDTVVEDDEELEVVTITRNAAYNNRLNVILTYTDTCTRQFRIWEQDESLTVLDN